MEENYLPTNTIQSRHSPAREKNGCVCWCTHLKPRSSYSRMICGNIGDGRSNSASILFDPDCNLKMELVNNQASVGIKKLFDDSLLEESYKMPIKKRFRLNCSSPDLACVLDSGFSYPDERHAVPPPKVLLSRVGNEVGVSAPLSPDVRNVESPGSGRSEDSPSPAVRPTEASSDGRPAFDFDVNEILCLSPIESERGDSEGLDDLIECHSYCEVASFGNHQGVSERISTQSDSEGTGEGWECTDEGYFSKFYQEMLPKGQMAKLQGAEVTLQPTCTSSPLPKQETISAVGRKQPCPSSFDKATEKEVGVCRESPVSLSEVVLLPRVADEEGVDVSVGKVGGFSIGAPEQESPVRKTEEECLSDEPRKVQQAPIQECSVGTIEEGESWSSVPIQVKVKSVVVVPDNRCGRKDVQFPPAQNSINRQTDKSHRPALFERNADWEREKRKYLNAVSTHMEDNTSQGRGVMTELLHLMNTVAHQGASASGTPWQHPSDLTRRNYQRLAGKPRLTLEQWQNQNSRFCRRFASVPQMFKRSPVP